MGWSSSFLALLESRTIRPKFLLRPITTPEGFDATLSVASAHGLGADAVVVGGVTVRGQKLSTEDWTVGSAEWQVTLAMSDASALADDWKRGQLFEPLMGDHDYTLAEMQPIQIGQFWGLEVKPAGVVASFRDIQNALNSRLGRFDSAGLFGSPPSTSPTVTYSPTDTTVTVASGDTADFGKDSTGGASGILWMVPSSGSGGFWLTYTGTTATTFTGCSTVDLYGTTQATVTTGGTIYEGAYLSGHPLDSVLKVLTSTGAGTNGSYDTCPKGWSVIFPSSVVDYADFVLWKSFVLSAETPWQVAVYGAQDNPRGWLQDTLSPAGIFLVTRQGRISVRSAQDPWSSSAYYPGLVITDADIVRVDSHQVWDTGHRVNYLQTRVYEGDASTSGTEVVVNTLMLPAYGTKERTVDHLWTGSSTVANDIADRLAPYDCRAGSLLILTCATWRLAQLCAGDLVHVETTKIRGRFDYAGGHPCMVLQASPDYSGSTVQIALLAVADDTGDAGSFAL